MKKAKLNNNKESKKKEIVQSTDISLKKIVIISIMVVFVSFYFLTDYLISIRTTPSIVGNSETSKISFNDLYKQEDKSYYVLAILEEDENKDKYSIYEQNLTPLYFVDMNQAFNKSHVGDMDIVTDNIKDIVISDSTLFVIKDNKLESYHVGYENITKYIISNIKSSNE